MIPNVYDADTIRYGGISNELILMVYPMRYLILSIMMLLALQASNCPRGRSETKKPDLVSLIKKAKASAVQTLLQQGADPNARDESGYAPLHWACYCDQKGSIIKMLFEAGADIDVIDKDGWTLLDWAYKRSNQSAIKELIQKAIEEGKLNLRGRDGKTLLHYAAILKDKESLKLVKKLLQLGLDPNAEDNNGRTPWDDDINNHIKVAECSIAGSTLLRKGGS